MLHPDRVLKRLTLSWKSTSTSTWLCKYLVSKQYDIARPKLRRSTSTLCCKRHSVWVYCFTLKVWWNLTIPILEMDKLRNSTLGHMYFRKDRWNYRIVTLSPSPAIRWSCLHAQSILRVWRKSKMSYSNEHISLSICWTWRPFSKFEYSSRERDYQGF